MAVLLLLVLYRDGVLFLCGCIDPIQTLLAPATVSHSCPYCIWEIIHCQVGDRPILAGEKPWRGASGFDNYLHSSYNYYSVIIKSKYIISYPLRKKTEILTISLPKGLKQNLLRFAGERDIPVSQVAKDALNYFIWINSWKQAQRAFAPALRKLGLKKDEDFEKYFALTISPPYIRKRSATWSAAEKRT